jgi:hypothetical protein
MAKSVRVVYSGKDGINILDELNRDENTSIKVDDNGNLNVFSVPSSDSNTTYNFVYNSRHWKKVRVDAL